MAKQDFSFFHTLRVRWSEVDMQAIVFNGNYLNYFDVAFTEKAASPKVLSAGSGKSIVCEVAVAVTVRVPVA